MRKAIILALMVFILAGSVLMSSVLAAKTVDKNITTAKGEIEIHKVMTRECDSAGQCTINKEITIEKTKDNETKIISKNVSITINKEIEVDENNKTYLKINATLRKEIKIMPDTASERAIEVLKSKNITIELKDTGKYHVRALKKYKVLGFLKRQAEVSADIDAETGNVSMKKPWWVFMAREE